VHKRRPVLDPRRIVEEGYDRIAERHLAWASRIGVEVRTRYLGMVFDTISAGAAVLDLGCGAGGPVTRTLAGRYRLTGVDLSARSIALARRNVPEGQFFRADMPEPRPDKISWLRFIETLVRTLRIYHFQLGSGPVWNTKDLDTHHSVGAPPDGRATTIPSCFPTTTSGNSIAS
jgi:SAM-dependent methyltransferase